MGEIYWSPLYAHKKETQKIDYLLIRSLLFKYMDANTYCVLIDLCINFNFHTFFLLIFNGAEEAAEKDEKK